MEMDERKLRGGAALQWRNQSRRSGGTRAQMLLLRCHIACDEWIGFYKIAPDFGRDHATD